VWHAEQRERFGMPALEVFLARVDVRPMAGFGPCRVVACEREAVAEHAYCLTHQRRYYQARRQGGFDEARWRAAEQPVTGPGTVVLRGLPPLVGRELATSAAGAAQSSLATMHGQLCSQDRCLRAALPRQGRM
jgi:hypothetical protein